METRSRSSHLAISSVAVSILFVLIPYRAHAISLSPAVQELTAARGEIVESKISVVNTKGMEEMYFVSVQKFEPQEDGGSPMFISYEEDHLGLPQWIQLPFTEFRVPANSRADVPFSIAVPSDVASGGYYIALMISQAPADLVADNGAVIEAKTAALILLTVEGETVERAELLDFVRGDSMYSYRIQNQGNVHVLPEGEIKITDIFGRTVKNMDANSEQGRVLPGSTRMYQIEEKSANGFLETVKEQISSFAIGPMKATLDLTYGKSEQTISAVVSFWYVPWQLLLSAFVLLMVCLKLFTRRTK